MFNRGRYKLYARSESEYSARTIELVRRSIVIDMLGLLTLDWSKLDRWQRSANAFTDADYREFLDSGITLFHPAVDLPETDRRSATRKWFNKWNGFFARYPDRVARVDSTAGILQSKQQSKIGVLLGFQNSAHFESLEDVKYFHGLGQRVSQLTYNGRNALGFGCTDQRDAGLTEYGARIVRAMNETGMAIDVSHAGDRTTMDAFEASSRPVLITHSNCRALVSRHPRCKSDEAIQRMARTGGVMGITGIRVFVSRTEPTTIEHLLDHFAHVARLTGIEHVGIGSDNDLRGRDRLFSRSERRPRLDIAGLNHPKRVFDLTEGLVRRRYTDSEIEAILGGNFLRVLREIWQS
jgi:membrane dipeptidase